MIHTNKIRRRILAFLVTLLLFLNGCRSRKGDVLKVSLLKAGKADAIVVQMGAQTMVIDAGEEDGAELVAFLEKQEISKVDILIITHFDKDHVGGADTLVEAMEIGEVVLPDYETDGTEYWDFMKAMKGKNITPQRLTQPAEFTLGNATVLVEPPQDYTVGSGTGDIDNNFSLITTITYGENRLLFTGDAEKSRLREWLSGGTAEDCDFLKIPHHGIYNGALKELLETVTPEYAAICSSSKNPAEQKTLDVLEQYQVQTVQTKDGDIIITCDGNRLEVTQKKN